MITITGNRFLDVAIVFVITFILLQFGTWLFNKFKPNVLNPIGGDGSGNA
jgi:hypothetical protein